MDDWKSGDIARDVEVLARALTSDMAPTPSLERLTNIYLNAAVAVRIGLDPDQNPIPPELKPAFEELAEAARRRALEVYGEDLVVSTGIEAGPAVSAGR